MSSLISPSASDSRGITMLLALLIMAALMAAGIGASTIVVTELRSSAATDQGITAYYAADIGMERAMYAIYLNRQLNSLLGTGCAADTTCDQVRNSQPAFSGSTALTPGVSVQLNETAFGQFTKKLTIPQTQTAEVSFIDPDDPFGGSTARSLYLIAPGLGGAAAARVEVQWFFFLKSNVSGDVLPQNATARLISEKNLRHGMKIDLFTGASFSQDSAQTVDIANPSGITTLPGGVTFNQIAGWVIRIKAIGGDVPNLKVYGCTSDLNSACTAAGETSSSSCEPSCPPNRYKFFSDVTLTSRGRYRDASFILQAQVPWKLPSVGVFDYALFSEESLDKPG